MYDRTSIYRSPDAREEILRLYDRALGDLTTVDTKDVETRFGRTRVVVSGPEGAPPVVLLQGGNFLGPLSLS